MADHANYIDALLRDLGDSESCGYKPWRHAALTALLAERDALRVEAQNAKTYWRERAERRDAAQKSAADRDLRERLVCAALTGVMAHEGRDREFDCVMDDAIWMADKALAAMRKGESRE